MQVALLSLCLAGCQQRTFLMDESGMEEERIPVMFSGTIQTRMADNAWEADDKIGVFMFRTGQTEVTNAVIDNSNNRKYIYSSENSFSPATKNDTLFYPQDANVDFISYYPYSAVEDYQLKLDVSVQADPSSIDLLYSNNLKNIAKGNTQQTLEFTHRLAKAVFNIKAGTDFNAKDLVGLKLSVEDVAASATFNIFENELTLASNSNKTITAKTNEQGTQAEAIMLPQDCENKKVRIVLANRRTYTFLIGSSTVVAGNGDTGSATKDTEWAASFKYTYTITLNRDYYSVESIKATITDWTANNQGALDQSGSSTIDASIWDGTTSNIDWYDASLSTFNISTAEEFAGFSELVNGGNNFEGKTVNLLSDIDLNNKSWTPIGYDKTTSFKGTFNGGNHTVNGIAPVMHADSQVLGLFGDNSGAINDVIVSGTVSYSGDAIASVIMGGVAGMNRGTIKGCRNYASVTGGNTAVSDDGKTSLYIGGIAGYHSGSGSVEDCQNQGVITGENVKSTSSNVVIGGIAGYANASIKKSENDQSVRCKGVTALAGGIVGNLASETGVVSASYNYGSVTIEEASSASKAGGVVGSMTKSAKVSGSFNYAEVTANISNDTEYVKVGGIVGQNTGCQVISNTNNGAVSAVNTQTAACSAAGGIVGYNEKGGEIHKCTNGTGGSAQCVGVYGCIAGYNSTADTAEGYVYNCCTNNGTPTKWIGSATGNSSLAGVTTTEHTDE